MKFGDFTRNLGQSAALVKTGSVELQGVFVQCVQEAPQLSSEFLNRVLDNLNWTMTEFGPPHFARPCGKAVLANLAEPGAGAVRWVQGCR